MLRRLYVDNYKCFSNFEFKPGPLSLLLGRNGTGKSSVLDVLSSVRALALGHRDVLTAFPSRSRTRWDSRREQAFVLEVAAPFGLCSYALRVEHKSDERLGRVLEETLTVDAQPLFRFTGGDVHLHRDDHSAGPVFPADWSRSALATVPERHDNTKLWWFKRWLERLWVVSIDPREMASESAMETSEPGQRLGDFASWYRHVLQEQPGDLGPLFGELEAVLPGFVSLNLQQVGERARRLTAAFRPAASAAGATPLFGLEELSDGQRCLIALYSLLRLGLRRDTLLCFDEPDNFVALSEIQPWLISLRERVESDGAQALVASHHPEVANYLASDCGQLFERDGLGPVRVRKFVVEPASGLTPAETLARGWE